MNDELLASIKKKSAAPVQESALSSESTTEKDDTRASLKWQSTLKHLLRGPRHRFDAERWGDHALHSTVSSLQQEHGLQIDRVWQAVPTRFGKTCRVRAYWVAELSRNHALRLVARRKRNTTS